MQRRPEPTGHNRTQYEQNEGLGAGFHFVSGNEDAGNSESTSIIYSALDSGAEYKEKVDKAQAEWDRRRRSGLEDYGSEMDKDASVWKAYVQEADRVDKEMVQGWNKSLDVLLSKSFVDDTLKADGANQPLVFAALFSAILTAFVIVSSADLKPDSAEESAQTLVAIFHTLQSGLSGQSYNFSVTTIPTQAEFVPSHTAVVVNILWYLSLSISVAVSLLAMLAKEWSHSFVSNRSGQMYEQARRRQQRWDGIQHWKMMDVITLLPVLMHLALLLFAVGLSIRLWDIHFKIAIPVITTTTTVALLYFSSYVLPLMCEFCPYATASSKLVQEYLRSGLAYIDSRARPWFSCLNQCLIVQARAFLPYPTARSWAVTRNHTETNSLAYEGVFSPDDPTPMDDVTSRMLSWMVTNCEEPKVIDRAIQSLSGAKPWLPRLPLLKSGFRTHVLNRLNTLVGFDSTKRIYFLKEPALPDLTLIYFRALFFLCSYHNNEGFYSDAAYGAELSQLQNTWKLKLDSGHGGFVVDKLFSSWGYDTHFNLLSGTTDSAAYMNNFKLPSLRITHDGRAVKYDVYECFQVAPNYIEQHITGQTVYHPATLMTLVQSLTNQFSMPSRPWSENGSLGVRFPMLLIKLLLFLQSTGGDEDLYHAIAVGLAICAFSFGKYPGWNCTSKEDTGTRASEAWAYHNTPRHLIHFRTGNQLSFRDSRSMETRSLLNFGLLALFDRPISQLIDARCVETLTQAFQAIDQRDEFNYQYVYSLSPDFTFERHASHALTHFLHDHSTSSYAPPSKPAWFTFISAMLQRLTSTPRIYRSSLDLESIYHLLVRHLCTSPSADLQYNLSRFLNSINVEVFTKELLVSLDEETVLRMLLQASVSGNSNVAPTAMRLAWSLVQQVFRSVKSPKERYSILRPLLETRTPNPPSNIGDTGLAQMWLPHLHSMSASCPGSIAGSGILEAMLNFYLPPFLASMDNLDSLERDIAVTLQGLQASCRQSITSSGLGK